MKPLLLGIALLTGGYTASAYVGTLPQFGMNIDYLTYYQTQIPFRDIAHNSNDWVRVNPGLGIYHDTTHPLSLDAYGYPTELTDGWQVYALAITDSSVLPTGNYRLSWTGSGTVTITGTGTSLVSSGSNERIYNLSGSASGQLRVYITATTQGNHVQNIRLEMPGYSSATSRFYDDFADELAQFGVLRFLDWCYPNNNTTISQWSQRNVPASMFWGNIRGVPFEIMVELCNETNSDLWLTIPHLADDTYVENLALLVRYGSDGVYPYTSTQSNPVHPPLNSNLRVWVEYSNEVWSPGSPGPAQYNYANNVLRPLYGVSTIAEAYARRASELWDIFEDVFGSSDNIVKVIGGRNSGGTGWSVEVFLEVSGKADVLAIAPYIGGEVASGSSIPQYIVNNNYNVPHSELFDALLDNVDTTLRANIAANRVTAELNGAKLVTYEGGPGVVATGSLVNDTQLTAYLTDFHRAAGWVEVYENFLQMLSDERVHTYTAYEYVRASGNYGYFGHKEYQAQPLGDENTPGSAHKMRTLLEWISDPPPPPGPYPVETIIIDNDGAGFYNNGLYGGQTWGSNYYGSNWAGRTASSGSTNSAQWIPTLLDREGWYMVEVYRFGTGTDNQPFYVDHAGGTYSTVIDMTAGTGWVDIGDFYMDIGSRVRTHNGYTPVGGSWAVADAVRFTPVSVDTTPDITTTSLPNASVGVAYSQSLTATGGEGTLVWSIVSGSLPSGLSLSSAGVISGTPTSSGTSNFTVQVEDEDEDTDTQALSIQVTSSGYTYLRLDINGVTSGAWGRITEIDWLVGSTQYPASHYTSASGDVTSSGGTFDWRAYDGSTASNSYWDLGVGGSGASRSIIIELPGAISPTAIRIVVNADNRAPIGFTCYGSNNGTSWTQLTDVSGLTQGSWSTLDQTFNF